MNILSKLSIACTLLLCIASCKKKDNDDNTTPARTGCLLYSVVSHHNGCKDSIAILGSLLDKMSGLIEFNNCPGGMPGQATITGKSFIYDGNNIYIVDTATFANHDTLIVDAGSLRILEVHRYSSIERAQIDIRYDYAADGTLLRGITGFNSMSYDTAFYIFSNGDMVMRINTLMGNSDTSHYTYYTDKPVPANGYITQNGLRYGNAFTYKSAHLLKSTVDGQGMLLTQYSYDANSDGNITRCIRTATSGAVKADTTIYHYACPAQL